jgi:ArsR family transcriptional regulator
MITKKRILPPGKIEQVARILKALAHPVKLEILEVLEHEEAMDVSTLCGRLRTGCELSMMSHHLSKMKDHGILKSEKKGKQVYYSIVDKNILKLFDCMENCEII